MVSHFLFIKHTLNTKFGEKPHFLCLSPFGPYYLLFAPIKMQVMKRRTRAVLISFNDALRTRTQATTGSKSIFLASSSANDYSRRCSDFIPPSIARRPKSVALDDDVLSASNKNNSSTTTTITGTRTRTKSSSAIMNMNMNNININNKNRNIYTMYSTTTITTTNQKQSEKTLGQVRTDWTKEEIQEMYQRPLLELVFEAATVHRMYHDPKQVQQCTLLSIKTGGCPETCNYCSQSSSWKKETELKAEKLMQVDDVFEAAKRAKAAGSTRFCMGTAWRGPSQVGEGQFDRVLTMTKQVKELGMEVCATLGMLTPDQAVKLREAGLTAYNHNLDTSPEYYPKVTSSRKYEDRLNTIAAVRDAGISVCCGGILGLGEEESDRASLMHVLASLPEHPESVPINALVPVKGTPFENLSPPKGLEMVRAIAVARILMPKTVVRLSAGRINMSDETQAMCFLAGANSVFTGDKLLTTPNNDDNEDSALFKELGLEGRPAFVPYGAGGRSSDGSEWNVKHAHQ